MTFVNTIVCQSQSLSQKFLLRKELYIELQIILIALHDQDWSVNLLSGPRQ